MKKKSNKKIKRKTRTRNKSGFKDFTKKLPHILAVVGAVFKSFLHSIALVFWLLIPTYLLKTNPAASLLILRVTSWILTSWQFVIIPVFLYELYIMLGLVKDRKEGKKK